MRLPITLSVNGNHIINDAMNTDGSFLFVTKAIILLPGVL